MTNKRKISLTLSWIVIGVAILVIFGWFFDIDILKRLIPGSVTMKFSTAISFLLSGFVLQFILRRESGVNVWADIFLPATTLVISILMGTTLLSVIFNFKSGIENLFIADTPDAILTTVPGRPSIGTMVGFILMAILGVISLSGWRRRRMAYLILGMINVLIGSIALIGYIISIPQLFYAIEGISTAMAIHTAILFILLGVGFYLLSDQKIKKEKLSREE